MSKWLTRFFCGLALGAVPATAADIGVHSAATGDVVLSLSGIIMPFDGARFVAEIDVYDPQVVEIAGPGGDFLSATQIGVAIKTRGIATHAIGDCVSSCAYVWMAGNRMIVDEGVTIDIHLPMVDDTVPYAGPQWLPSAVLGWYLGRLELSPEMMEAFFVEATEYGQVANRYFDMIEFARYWGASVEVVPLAEIRARLAAAQ